MEKSVMWEYIEDIPASIAYLLDSGQVDAFLDQYPYRQLKTIILIGSGSSYNAAAVARRLLEEKAGITTAVYTPSNYTEAALKKHNPEETLVIGISQTGTSTGVLEAVRFVKESGYAVLTLTERKDTPIEAAGDYYLNFLSGLEDCNAKTKGYINSLILLQLLAMKLARRKGAVTKTEYEQFINEIEASKNNVPETIKTTVNWLEQHRDWAAMSHFLVIGSGTDEGTANEGMLKVLETLCIPASVCELGEFSHGFHRTITSASNVILIQTEEMDMELAGKTADYLNGKASRLLVIHAGREKKENPNTIHVDYQKYTESSINIAVVFQVMAAYLPEVIGYDPNRPSNNDYTSLVNTRV